MTTSYVNDYLGRGYSPVPVPSGEKAPDFKGWQNYKTDPADLSAFAGTNVGLLLGAPSGGLVDVDLDAPEAVAAAGLLPATGMVSGRAGAPRSHHWYQCPDAPKKANTSFDDPTAPADDPGRRRLVELRSTGGQTVAPPSVHPTGEEVVWHDFGDPAGVAAAELAGAVARVGAAALLARHWPGRGGRQDAFLALSGGLARAGWAVDEAESFVLALAEATGDDEARSRVDTVARTFEKVKSGDQATGWKTLAGLAGGAVVDRAREWLGCLDPKATMGAGPVPGSPRPPAGPRYRPAAPYVRFPAHALPAPWGDYCTEAGRLLKCDDAALVALPQLRVCSKRMQVVAYRDGTQALPE